MNQQPPPPPPHGSNPKSSGLPPGNYDIFIIPPHSAGSGFIYLPSFKPNVNSFIAGFASALMAVVIGSMIAPALQVWWNSAKGSGGAGMILVVIAVGLGAWALGRTQLGGGPGLGGGGSDVPPGVPPHAGPQPNTHQSNGYASGGRNTGPMPGGGNMPGGVPNGGHAGAEQPKSSWQRPASPPPNSAGTEPPKSSWQRPASPPPNSAGAEQPKSNWQSSSTPPPHTTNTEPPKPSWQKPTPPPGATGTSTNSSGGTAKGAWERAREETKKREDERKAKEAERKRKEEVDKRLKEAREKEARERETREQLAREKEIRDNMQKERQAKEMREKTLKESREKEIRENLQKERDAKEMRERQLRENREKDIRENLQNERQAKEMREKLLKERREKEIREKLLKERLEKEIREKLLKERQEKEKLEKEKEKAKVEEEKPKGSTYAFSAVGERTNPWPNGHPSAARSQPNSPTKKPPTPSVRTYLGTEDEHSFRPYDKPKKPMHKRSQSSLNSDYSYAASQSTSRTTPPPSHRGAYSTKDPDKIVIKAVYAFNNAFLKTPTSQLVSNTGSVTDGLILRITTEGLFIDDDVRGVPQREWDVKAWTMKLVETGELKSARLHVLRASIRDQEGKKYVFVITEEESWKVAVGLQRLRKGTQVRALGVSGMSASDARGTLENLGWG